MKRDWIFKPAAGRHGWRSWVLERTAEFKPWLCSEASIAWAQLWRRPALPLALAVLAGGLLATRGWVWLLGLLALAVLSGVCSQWQSHGKWRETTAWVRFGLLLLGLALGGLRLGWPFWLAEDFQRAHPAGRWSGEVKVEQILSRSSSGSDWVTALVTGPRGVRLALSGSARQIQPGARLQVAGYLERPARAANPGGFDRQDWLWRQGIWQELDLKRGEVIVRAPGEPRALVRLAEHWRQFLQDRLVDLVGRDRAALLSGLLIGSTEGMDKASVYDFRQAGLSHLTAVSGANIAFWLTPLTGWLRRFKIRRLIRQLLLLGTLILFGFLTGWQVSVSRAVIVTALFMLGRLFHRRSDPLNALGLAVIVFALIQPLAILSFSFWLSGSATLGLLAGGPALARRLDQRWPNLPAGWSGFLGTSLAVQVLVLPAAAVLARQLSLVGLIANIPALFLVEWLTVASLLALLAGAGLWLVLIVFNSLPGLAIDAGARLAVLLGFLGRPLAVALDSLLAVAHAFARVAWGRWPVAWLNLLLVCGLGLLMIRSLLRLSRLTRHLLWQMGVWLIALGLALALARPLVLARDQVWFLSVGQGDATLIVTRSGQTALIDTGKPGSGWQVVLPALDALGIRSLDVLILSHGHLDHAGGAAELLATGRVRQLLVPELDLKHINTTGGQDNLTQQLIDLAEAGDIPWGTLTRRHSLKLSPTDELRVVAADRPVARAADTEDLNEQAIHFQLQLAGYRFLLMSDCTPASEESLLSDPKIVNNEVLKVAHHGSRMTTQAEFLDLVRPELAIISVGPNQYGHPAPELLQRLTARSVPTLRTDRGGAVRIDIAAGKLFVQEYGKEKHG